MDRRWKRALTVAGATASFAALAVIPGMASANAATPDAHRHVDPICHSRVEEQWIGSTFEYRVAASCSVIPANTEARGVLNAKWYPDKQTEWFTTTNKTYYSPWGVSPWAEPTSRVDYQST